MDSGLGVEEPVINDKVSTDSNDDRIKARLDLLARDSGYWDFRKGAHRDALHGITQYPAMMVPAMQGKLLDTVCDVLGEPNQLSIADPFLGSGTTQVEAMRRGLNFYGQDLNPFAILISKAKAGPFDICTLQDSVKQTISHVRANKNQSINVEFENRDKWFSPHVSKDLCKLRAAISLIRNDWVRKVLWVILGETIRLTSNSRTSTFKLHIRSAVDLKTRNINTLDIFTHLASDVIKKVEHEIETLNKKQLLKKGRYVNNLKLKLGNSSISLPSNKKFDILLTSPPYGDGTTTVPYGQYSYLPLQWIDKSDIEPDLNDDFLQSTHEIDTRSLGGSRRFALKRAENVMRRSPSLTYYLDQLKALPEDRRQRVASFFADLGPVVDVASRRVRKDGYMIWTVGNRSVGGITQPFDEILSELIESKGNKLIHKIQRTIPRKRMANRNSSSSTMRGEYVLVFKSGDDNADNS